MFEGFVDETPPAASAGRAAGVDGVVPGPELADRLVTADLAADRPDAADRSPAGEEAWQAATASGLGRVEGWSRMAGWVQAQEMLAVEALVARAVERAQQRPPGTLLDEHRGGVGAEVDSLVAELALSWQVTQRTAARRVDEAVSLVNGVPLLIEAMLDGRLGIAHVRALGGVLLDLDPALAEHISRDLLEGTSSGEPIARTPVQLAGSARRAAIRLDPGSARRRERRARREREVHLGAESDGMATLTAYLPAAEALLLYRTIDAHAQRSALADPGDDAAEGGERSPGARRADALCDLVALGALLAGGAEPATAAGPVPDGVACTGDCRCDAAADGEPTDGEIPAGDDSHAVAPAEDELSEDDIGLDRNEVASDDPDSASDARVDQCRDPADPSGDDPPGRQPPPRPPRPPRNVQVRVVVSADTLLGLDDPPAEVTGYGPITAAEARGLAAGADATWRRVLTDPVSGAVLDVGHRRYRPPAAMAEHVRNRDLTCTFPGCRVPSQACDLDHLVVYDPNDPDGRTAADNLHPPCRHHHRIKHLPGWSVARGPDGSVLWTTPTGRRFRTIRPVLVPATVEDVPPRPEPEDEPRGDLPDATDLDDLLRSPAPTSAATGGDDAPSF
ncbi:HNH endonuclease [Actinomycetospora sp. NBRC 106375]|uniref:HNH endonuclease signature motif containing protein n=1 Tax=Actinomycetospora sp. NBRC 106375 TaxID=3032207 RepID=UPI0024A18529|nr:HNH endonuclease signature motif containing protein [Actinomycetospora sp. NBRC 106375]GLZ46679.1 HNH endonuclease [Actinomycetospora sp. NBRC 106375]